MMYARFILISRFGLFRRCGDRGARTPLRQGKIELQIGSTAGVDLDGAADDVAVVLERLLAGSQNHLAAFERQA